MPETDLQAVTSGVEAALGSTAETAHSFWEKYLGANALSKIIAAAIMLIVCVVFIKLLMRLTSAVMLLTSKPYQVGDFVEISGMQGTVREIGILSTKLVTIDGRLISIPNSQAVSGSITNFSTEEDRRVVLSVSASYDDDIEKVKSALVKAAQDPRVLPIEPVFARVSSYGDNAIEYTLRFWVKNADYWSVYFDVLENVKRVFDEDGISMTYPHLVVHTAKPGVS